MATVEERKVHRTTVDIDVDALEEVDMFLRSSSTGV